MEFRVLGPMEVWEGDRCVDVGPRMHRAVLALLVMQPNRVVSVDHLVDHLWGEDPPATAETTLRGYVAGLRRALEPGRPARTPPAMLLTHSPGYLLRVPPSAIDAARFEAAVAEGRELAAAGRARAARDVLGRALELWRGAPYADLAYETFVGPEAARLTELRAVAAEARAEADLAVGDHAGVVGELERLVAAEPLRERRWELYALALYRCGRQAEALRALERARRTLAEELGIEPRPPLRQLESDILAQAPTLDWIPAGADGRADLVRPARPAAEVVRGSELRPAVLSPRGPDLVGRGRELQAFDAAIDAALAGRASVVLVAGEPGIGKTRLAGEAAARAAERGAAVAWGRCFEGEGAPAFWPWTQVVRTLAGGVDADALRSWVGSAAGDLAHVVPELREVFPDAQIPAALDPDQARLRLFDAVTRLLAAAARRPLVVVLDDLHWADPPSLQLLPFAAAQLGDSPLLLVATYRDTEVGTGHPLAAALAALARLDSTTRLGLRGLAPVEVRRFVAEATGRPPTHETVAALWDRTEGNPFFLGQLVRLIDSADGDAAPDLVGAVPGGVQDVIRHRLSLLPPDATRLLGMAAVIGRDFEVAALGVVSALDEELILEHVEAASHARLVEESRDVVGRYRFVHALVRETLYDELSGLRRARLHRRVGEALEELGGVAPAELAHHFWRGVPAGGADKALEYAVRAADDATARLAYEQAEDQLRRALELVARLPGGPHRSRQELDLQTRLWLLLAPLRGYADADAGMAADRARVLCHELGESRQLLRPLWRLWAFHTVGAQFRPAEECGRQLLNAPGAANDPLFVMAGHHGLGMVALHRGQLALARDHLERSLDLPAVVDDALVLDVFAHHGPTIQRGCLAVVLGLVGDEGAAREADRAALDLAGRIADRFTSAFAPFFTAWLGAHLRDLTLARRAAKEGAAACEEGGYRMWCAADKVIGGWARALQGEGPAGAAEAAAALGEWEDTGARMLRSFFLGLLGEAQWQAGKPEQALSTIDDALAAGRSAGEHFYDAELHRLRGALTLNLSPDRLDDVEASFRKAVALAQDQGARQMEQWAWASLSALPAGKGTTTKSATP